MESTLGVGEAGSLYDPTPALVPTDAGPGHVVQDRHGPLDLTLLDQVDEGVQRLAVAPLTPLSKRIKDLEAMVRGEKREASRNCARSTGDNRSC